jgi:hypothetical protein
MTKLQRTVRISAACLAALALLSACSSGTSPSSASAPGAGGAPNPNAIETNPAGDIPDTQAFVAYTPADKTYTVQVPSGWARTGSGPAVTFTDKYNSIRVETMPRPSAPTVSSAQTSTVPAIQSSAQGYKPGKVSTVARTAGQAVLITYEALSAPNPVTGKVAVEAVERYEFWKSGTLAVLTLSAPAGSDNVDPWRKVTDSFSWQG